MKNIFANLHKMDKVKKQEAIEILDTMLNNEALEDQHQDLLKLYTYFSDIKNKKATNIHQLAQLFVGDKEDVSTHRYIVTDDKTLYVTDSYRLLEIKGVDLDPGSYLKGKKIECNLTFPNCKPIIEGVSGCGTIENFNINDYDMQVDTLDDGTKLKFIDVHAGWQGDKVSRLSIQKVKDITSTCSDITYHKAPNGSSASYFTGKFKDYDIKYIIMPLAHWD